LLGLRYTPIVPSSWISRPIGSPAAKAYVQSLIPEAVAFV
jgi:hypothetical protein